MRKTSSSMVQVETRRQFLRQALLLGAGALLLRGSNPLDEHELPDNPFSGEAFQQLLEGEDLPKIDPWISVAHIGGRYPKNRWQPFFDRQFFAVGLDFAEKLGFQAIEVEFSGLSRSHYQGPPFEGKTLADFVHDPLFSEIFTRPGFSRVILSCDTYPTSGVNSTQLSYKERFSQEKLYETEQQFYAFASKILKTHSISGKEIVIQIPNELDWFMLGNYPWTDEVSQRDASETAVMNARDYVGTITKAIHAANNDHPDKPPLLVAVEINKVWDAMHGKIRAANSVIPYLTEKPDIIGYSAYDTGLNPKRFQRALSYLKDTTGCQIAISEFGIPEQVQRMSLLQTQWYVSTAMSIAHKEECRYFCFWQLFDNECDKEWPDYYPSNGSCNGYWMVRPDGTLSYIYRSIQSVNELLKDKEVFSRSIPTFE